MNLLLGCLVGLAVLLWFDDRRKEKANVKRQHADAVARRKKKLAQLDGCWRQADKDAFKGWRDR